MKEVHDDQLGVKKNGSDQKMAKRIVLLQFDQENSEKFKQGFLEVLKDWSINQIPLKESASHNFHVRSKDAVASLTVGS